MSVRPLATVVALAALAALVGVWPETPARSTEGVVSVLIDSMTPSAPGHDSKLRITGRVANDTEQDLTSPSVRLRLSPDPLTSRSEVAAAFSVTTEPAGIPVPGTERALGTELGAGQQREFRIRTRVKDLPLGAGPAVHGLSVEATSAGQPVAHRGSALPWFPKGSQYDPSGLAFVWPLAQQPALAADRVVVDPDLPAEFESDGRLGRLLDVGSRAPVSFLVDAATVQIGERLADGYQVRDGDGLVPGDGAKAAQGFLADLRSQSDAVAPDYPGYADADVDALRRARLDSFVTRSVTLPQPIAKGALDANGETVLVSAGGNSAEATLRAVVNAGIRTTIMAESSFPPQEPLTYTPTGATHVEVAGSDVTVLLADWGLGALVDASPDTAEQRAAVRQEFLAQTAMMTLERPSTPRRFVVLPTLDWAPPMEWMEGLVKALDDAPWMSLIGLNSVDGADVVPRTRVTNSREQRSAQLPPSYLDRVADAEQDLASLTRIVDDPAGFGETFTLALQRAVSSLWRDDRRGRRRLLNTIVGQLAQERDKVRVVSTGQVNLSGEIGKLPLTVANDLDRSVTVGVELKADNAIRLQYEAPDPISVGAEQKAGLEIPIRVIGSQPLHIDVVITDSKGREYGESAELEVRSTASIRIAAIVVGMGSVALAILIVLRFLRRRRDEA